MPYRALRYVGGISRTVEHHGYHLLVAAQRIKGLSLGTALKNAFLGQRGNPHNAVKSLISSFRYACLGPGVMWETCAKRRTPLTTRVPAVFVSCPSA